MAWNRSCTNRLTRRCSFGSFRRRPGLSDLIIFLSDPAVWYDKGNTLSAIGQLEGALNCFNEALILDPKDTRAWNSKGGCLASLGRLDEAIACYDNALLLNPSYALAWYAHAVIEERLGYVENALTAYKRFLALGSDQDAATFEKVRQHVSALETASQFEPALVA